MRRYRWMNHRDGFTLSELLVVIAAGVMLAVIGGVVFVQTSYTTCSVPPRAICSMNLKGISVAMAVYAVSNNDVFPIAGEVDPIRSAQGFQGRGLAGRPAGISTDPLMVNNMTASLWLLVQDGSVAPKSWTCPETTDTKQPIGTLATEWDFSDAQHLSYSSINMYHTAFGKHWSSNAPRDYVLMGDDNNATGAGVHTAAMGGAAGLSRNHHGGQNVAFGDGRVAFISDPMRGPHGDNVNAMTVGGADAAPTLGLNDGDAVTTPAVADRDVVLIPLTGNSGTSLSGTSP